MLIIHIIIYGGGSPIVVRAFCRSIVHVLCRISFGIHEAEVEFLLCSRGDECRHGFLQGPQFGEDIAGNGGIFCRVLIRTDRRALDNIHLGSLGIDAKIIEGIVGTLSRFTHIIYHELEVGEVIHSALLLQHHLSINLIPFSYIGSISSITVSRKIAG